MRPATGGMLLSAGNNSPHYVPVRRDGEPVSGGVPRPPVLGVVRVGEERAQEQQRRRDRVEDRPRPQRLDEGRGGAGSGSGEDVDLQQRHVGDEEGDAGGGEETVRHAHSLDQTLLRLE